MTAEHFSTQFHIKQVSKDDLRKAVDHQNQITVSEHWFHISPIFFQLSHLILKWMLNIHSVVYKLNSTLFVGFWPTMSLFIWTILISVLIMIILTNELLLTLGHEMLCHLAPQRALYKLQHHYYWVKIETGTCFSYNP